MAWKVLCIRSESKEALSQHLVAGRKKVLKNKPLLGDLILPEAQGPMHWVMVSGELQSSEKSEKEG